MSKESIKPHEAPDFSEFITDLVNGEVNQKLTMDLAKVTEAVNETGLVGELAVKFIVKKEGDRAIVAVEIKKKVPEHAAHATLFYFGHEGLVREDPRQLKLKGLDAPNLRTIGGDDDE